MIQILITPNEHYSLAESAQMAIEAGAGWLMLSIPADEYSGRRDDMAAAAELAREAGVILTVIDNIEAARELGLSGIFLTALNPQAAINLRNELGPEPIIGTMVGSAADASALANADIDYFGLPYPSEGSANILAAIRSSETASPVVAYMPDSVLDKDKISAVIAAGYNGMIGGDGNLAGAADDETMLKCLFDKD